MKTELHEFPVGIYPRRLWVAVGDDYKFLSDYFGDNIKPFPDDSGAVTLSVQNKKSRPLGGFLVWFPNRKEMTAEQIAHEAVHFALGVFDYTDCRISSDNQEPFAYLVGWAVEMLDRVRRKDYNVE